MSRATPYQLDVGARFGTWEWDLATDESTWSDELYAILGLAPETALPGQSTFASAVHADDVASVTVVLDRVRQGGARAELELRIVRDKTVRLARLRAWRSPDARRLIAVVEDVTSQLAITDRMSSVGTFAAGVAHEINNPLAFVAANLELIAEGGEARDVDVLVREARHGIHRIQTVVRGLMTFSRVEAAHHEPLDVNRVIEVALGIAHAEIRQRARLVRELRPVPAVDANAARLGQVFVNLLVNALQAIPPGHQGAHEIAVATDVDAQGRVVVEVRDTGRGIPRSIGTRVFEPFVTTRPAGAGPGLGLSVCRNIVHALGGEIGFESEPGKTVFRVVLPATTRTPAPQPAEPATAPAPARRGSVLIVEDEIIFASSLRRLLLRDHDVSIARDGQDALDRLRAGERFDAIVSDVMMPGLGGIDLYNQLRELSVDQSERIIFITGSNQYADFFARITNPCFEKPCDLAALRTAIRRLVG